jgi:hypothetical protein
LLAGVEVREANLGLFVSFWRIARHIARLGLGRAVPLKMVGKGTALQAAEKLNFLETAENGSLQNALGTIRLPRVKVFYLPICAVSAHMPSLSAACFSRAA